MASEYVVGASFEALRFEYDYAKYSSCGFVLLLYSISRRKHEEIEMLPRFLNKMLLKS